MRWTPVSSRTTSAWWVTVDLDSIMERERVTKHDVKARIEEFTALAGHEHIHKGMTSRDLTENVEQLQVRDSLVLIRDRCVAALSRLAELAVEHRDTVMTGRTHNVPAQAITLGKRLANAGEELLQATRRLQELIDRYPAARGQGSCRHAGRPTLPARRRHCGGGSGAGRRRAPWL